MLSSAPICILLSILMLILFCIGFSIYAKSYNDNGPRWIQYAVGILLGGIAIGLIYCKIRYEDVVFDFSTVMLCLSGVFYGMIPTATATLMATAMAAAQGYGVLPPEVITAQCIYTIAAGVIGIIFGDIHKRNIVKSTLAIVIVSIVTHAIMALCIYTTQDSPACNTPTDYYIIAIVILPIATMLTARLINSQIKHIDTERQLRQLEEKYYKLILCNDDIFWEIDTSGKVTYVSDNVTQTLGYKSNELIDRMPHYFIEDVESIRLITEYGNNIERPGHEHFRHDLVFKHKKGNSVYCDTRCMRVTDSATQKSAGFVCVTRNVTNAHLHAELSRHNQKFIREQTSRLLAQQKLIDEYKQLLIQANKDIDEARESSNQNAAKQMTTITNICSEIMPTIDDIYKYASILHDQSQPAELKNATLNQTLYAAEFLKTFANDLIDSNALAKGFTKLTISIANIEDAIIDLCNYHNSRNLYLLKKSIIMQHIIDLAPDEKIIKADIQHLKRIINILINNSYVFTNAGQITVSCSLQSDSELLISVADTGIGVPESAYQNMFKPFNEATIPSLFRQQGAYKHSGLGLSIAKMLVDLMGGQIWFVSGVGKGTTISFTVPFIKAGEMASQQANIQYKWQDYTAIVATANRYTSILTCETLAKTHIKYHCIHIDTGNSDYTPPDSQFFQDYDVIITDLDAAKTPHLQDIARRHPNTPVITIDDKTAPAAICKQIDQHLTKKA